MLQDLLLIAIAIQLGVAWWVIVILVLLALWHEAQ